MIRSSLRQISSLLVVAVFCGCGAAQLLAQESPVGPSSELSSPPIRSLSPQTFLERDPATGVYQMFLLLPSGERRLLQTFPQLHPRDRGPLTGSDADYLNALNAIPVNERFIIGVELKAIPEGLHVRLGIPADCGLIVANLVEEKPAAQAGVKKHDLLLKINGTPVCHPGDVVRLVNEAKGEAITLTLLRDKEPFELKVIPVEAGENFFPPDTTTPSTEPALPGGVLPPGVQVAGPGMIVPSPRSADIELLHADLTALQAQVKALCKEVEELQAQLQKK